MRPIRFLLLLLTAAALAACGSQNNTSEMQPTTKNEPSATQQSEDIPTGKLPQDVKPLAYNIDFVMNPDKPGFSAHEVIHIRLTEPRDTIWFHGRGVDVKRARLVLANDDTLDVQYEQVTDYGVAKLTLPKTVSPQKASIVLDYSNPYSGGLLGAYKVKEGGKNYIFTQFEAIAARRAFPSFDEPAFKTPYTYSFTVPASDKVVANTPVKSKTQLDNGMVKWQFMTTKPLPTYLVAFAVGPLDIVKAEPIAPNAVRDRPIPLYGVTVQGKGDQIQYALEHAGEIVTALEQYLDIAYPYHKLALIAVPDFGAGAMENVGAITFRESLLLMDPDTAPTWQLRAYWSVAAHELAHMWTGDLVTVPWWNDIWMNEAFATWLEQKVMLKLHPEWKPETDILASRQRAMYADSLVTARAVRQPIEDTGDIKTAFDGITYAKGAAVIAMFENYVGEQAFQQGLHNYLMAHAHESGTLGGFLTAISKSAGQDVGPAFKSFLNQPGLPMIKTTLSMQNGTPTVHLVQSRYLPIGSSGDRQAQHWIIPVCMRYPVDGEPTEQCYMLANHEADVALQANELPAWLMPNSKGVGYYQWALGKTGLQDLTDSFDQLSVGGQLSLANSIGAAFGAGEIDTGQALRAFEPMARSDNEAVATEPMNLIEFSREHLVSDSLKDKVSAYARKLYSDYNVAEDFAKGGAPDDANQRVFEAQLAGFLAQTGQSEKVRTAAVDAAMRLLDLDKDGDKRPNLEAVASEFIPVALRVAIDEKGAPVFDALYGIFTHAKNPFIRGVTLRAMANAKDPDLARRVRSMALEPGLLKQNEIPRVLRGQLGQPATREATWQWFKQHYDAIVDALPAQYVSRMPAIARYFCSDAKAQEVKAFFTGRMADYPGSKQTLKQAMEAAHLCAARRKAQSPSAAQFFSQL